MEHLLLQPDLYAPAGGEAAEMVQLRAALRAALEKADFQEKEAKKLALALAHVQSELLFQAGQAEWRSEELAFANLQLSRQYSRSDSQADELLYANRGLAAALEQLSLQSREKEAQAAELRMVNIELDYQNSEKDKRAAELAAANRKLAFENHEKEARAAELLEAIAGLEAFAFISSHDLQEPVRKILLWLDQLRPAMERSFSDKEKQRFDRVIGAAYRMRQLIGDLYTYSRVNHIGQDMGKVSLNEVLAAVVEDLGPRLAETGGLVEAGDLCPAYGVRAHFGLLLEHLVDNGLKFARPGVPPRIRVAATRVAGESNPVLDPKAAYCRLIVEDNGIGFDTAGADRIFEIFQRLHAQDAYPGTGIGLALVRKITLACKGVVEVQSTPGSGSIFTLYFLLPSGFAVA